MGTLKIEKTIEELEVADEDLVDPRKPRKKDIELKKDIEEPRAIIVD